MNDTISKNAAINEIERAKVRVFHSVERAIGRSIIEILDEVEKDVRGLPSAQPEPHWIPVDLENNEPQLEEWVLVSSDGYVMQDCIVERGGKKIWYHGGNIQADDRYMPLPEPFKGVTE